ncbi:SET domain-containing protein-lysine N-methyltransferase [Pseudomonas orientalis]|uniref:SET domain-containing protein-lysine N-methyltransferase n=1 Tax=Pseudomonas orientalis TaxID=76758 RepID=UPI00215A074B|nr:SET domain-containing protein-lysine N-methyltransferase [Pseudomonas orientalis]
MTTQCTEGALHACDWIFLHGQVLIMAGISPTLTDTRLPLPNPDHPSDAGAPPVLPSEQAAPRSAAKTPLGHLAGALSWPIPPDADEQRRLRLITLNHAHHLGDQPLVMQTRGGVLEFLRYHQPLPAEVGNDPARTIETLVDSPQGQLMGKALQQRLQGIGNPTDYLLAGITLQMDPESIGNPHRHKIAGFDLSNEHYWGLHPCDLVKGLAHHLSAEGKTSAGLADVGAYLLLARSAPQFLINDIPATVKVGSHAWASLTIAAMTIEAQIPGKVPGMAFADVMSTADNARAAAPAITQAVGMATLLDWGVTHGVLTKRNNDDYLFAQLQSVQVTFNAQLQVRLSASSALDKELPTRAGIAREKLIERFGDLGNFFEEKIFSTDQRLGASEQTGLGGSHSLLDIAMMDWPNPRPFKVDALASSLKVDDVHTVLAALNANPRFGVREAFETRFNRAIEQKKSAVTTTVRHLIAQLPLEDRKNVEFGTISFFQEGSYVIGGGFTDRTPGPNKPGLLVKTQRDGALTQAYEINFNKGTIERTALSRAKNQELRTANRVSTTKTFIPRDAADFARATVANDLPPNSFDSQRSRRVGEAFVEHLELDDPAIKEQARGQTTLDKLQGGPKPLSEFLLNLVPFKSAIVNFQKGDYGDGALDLALDVFGFLTAGVAVAGKLIKIGRSALATGAKALRAANVIGVASIEMLNPVSGLGGIASLVGSGGLYLLSKGAKVVNRLRGASGSYDVLKAVSKEYDAAALGSLNVAGQAVEGGAVLKNGHWYAFDVDTMRPYGSPLEAFKVETRAIAGEVDIAHLDELSELSHELFGHFKVPDTRIAGLTRNSQGVYVAADGHLSHICHVDSSGEMAVYEVRQVTRTQDGVVQARVYHNNRQTELLVQHVQGDEWRRLGAPGGGQITAEHLRAWEALSPEQQASVTRKGFAKKNHLPQKTFEYYVKPDGQLSSTGVIVRDRPAVTSPIKVNETHLRDWQNMTQVERDEMTLDGFIGLHNLRPTTIRSYVRHNGTLTSKGDALVQAADPTRSNQIADDHLRQWDELFAQVDNLLTSEQFATQRGLNPRSWARLVNADGSLTQDGARRLERARQASAIQASTPMADHLRQWQVLPHEQQQSLTREGFARQKNIHPTVFERYVQPDGQLTATGVAARDRAPNTPFHKVTETHLSAWQNLSQSERDALTFKGFSELYHINPNTFKTHVRQNGTLSPIGMDLQGRTTGVVFNTITDDHFRQWKAHAENLDNRVTQAQFITDNRLNSAIWRVWVNVDGSLKKNASARLERAALGQITHMPSAPMKGITAEHLREWQALQAVQQQSLTRKGFARQKNIRPRVFERYVQPDGQLTDIGVALRDRAPNTPFHKVTETHLSAWQSLSQPEREALTLDGFSELYHINPNTFKTYARQDGIPSQAGIELLGRAAGVPPETITDDDLRLWKAHLENPDNPVTQAQFIADNGFHPATWRDWVNPDGSLKKKTLERLERAALVPRTHTPNAPMRVVTAEHLREWEALPAAQQQSLTRQGFTLQKHISRRTFEYYVQPDGKLSSTGVIVRDRATNTPFDRVSDTHITMWIDMTPQARGTMTIEGFAGHHNLNVDTFRTYVRTDGSLKHAGKTLVNRSLLKRPAPAPLDAPQPKVVDLTPHPEAPHGPEAPGPSSVVPPVVIKIEPIVSPPLPRHRIDNTLPILQDPQNPRLSLTQAIEGPIDTIRVTHWNGLLDGLDSATRQRISMQMKASIKDWLRTEGQHQSRFDEILEVVTALDDGGPNRGASVWARRDIAQFEVLGPYAGKYHASEASLFAEQRKQGSRAVLTYLFGTRSGNRSVSALHTGNTLSLINTSQLGTGLAWQSNNVISVAVGKNLTFYVALNDIKKGEELLVDYGPLYNTVPDIAIKPDPVQ